MALGHHDLLDLLDAPPARTLGLGAGGDRRGRRAARGRPRPPGLALLVARDRGGLLVSGSAFLIHEQNGWLFARSAFLHHLIGWTMVIAVVFPLGAAFRPRWPVWAYGFAATWIAVAVMLFSDRDIAPIFGHLSEFAGGVPVP